MSEERGAPHDGDAAWIERIRLDDRPGPAVRISSKRAGAMVDAALDACATSPSQVIAEAPVAAVRQGRGFRLGMLAAAAIFVLGGAAAAYWVARDRGWLDATPSTTPTTSTTTTATTATRTTTTTALGATVTAPTVNDTETREPIPEGPTAPVAVSPSTEVAAPARTPRVAARSETERDDRATAPPSSPEDLLREANRLRGSRRWREAERTYARVMGEHPGTMSAHVARIAAAEIRLSHLGDPRGALRLYRSALGGRGSGALALEARQGIAEAHRRMGNTAEEVRTLRAIVASHPGTSAARRAARRLAEIESTP